MVNDDNAVTALAEAVARIGRHEWPLQMTPTVRAFLEESPTRSASSSTPPTREPALAKLGTLARIVGATLRNTRQPDDARRRLQAQRHPATAQAMVDGRFLPGFEDELLATIDELLGPDVRRETCIQRHRAGDHLRRRPRRRDDRARCRPRTRARGPCPTASPAAPTPSPSACSASAASASSPLRLPADLDFAGMFHGVDERVPLDVAAVRRPRARPVPRPTCLRASSAGQAVRDRA